MVAKGSDTSTGSNPMLRALGDVAELKTGFAGKRSRQQQRVAMTETGSSVAGLVNRKNFNRQHLFQDDGLDRVEVQEKDVERYALRTGDVLLQNKGENYWAASAPVYRDPLLFSSSFVRIRAQDPQAVLPGFLIWYLNHPMVTAALRLRASGSTIPFVSLKVLKEFPIPIPPLSLQRLLADIHAAGQEELLRGRELLERRQEWISSSSIEALLRGCALSEEFLNA